MSEETQVFDELAANAKRPEITAAQDRAKRSTDRQNAATSEFEKTGKGKSNFKVEVHSAERFEKEGEETVDAKNVEEFKTKRFEDFTKSERERFLKDGSLPEPKEAKAAAGTENEKGESGASEDSPSAALHDSEPTKAWKAHTEKVLANIESLPDGKEVFDSLANVKLPVGAGGYLIGELEAVKNPGAVLKYLAGNQKDVEAISAMVAKDGSLPRVAQARISEYVRSIDKWISEGSGKVTKAGKPPSEVGGKGTAPADEVEAALKNRDTGAYLKAANARDAIAYRASRGQGRRR